MIQEITTNLPFQLPLVISQTQILSPKLTVRIERGWNQSPPARIVKYINVTTTGAISLQDEYFYFDNLSTMYLPVNFIHLDLSRLLNKNTFPCNRIILLVLFMKLKNDLSASSPNDAHAKTSENV